MNKFKNLLIVTFFLLLFVTLVACGKKNSVISRQQIVNKADLISLVNKRNKTNEKYFDSNDTALPEAGEDGSNEREYIETNTQVLGVDEADIIKTDGNFIYYRNLIDGSLNIFEVSDSGEIILFDKITVENGYITELYINDSYIITIGHISYYDSSEFYIEYGFYYHRNTFINIYDKDSLDLVYHLKLDAYLNYHRLVDNNLIFITDYYFDGEYILPSYEITNSQGKINYDLDYKDIYYFNNTSLYNMTIFNVLNIDTQEISSEAYLGFVNQIYMNKTSLYTTFYNYNYANNEEETVIVKFNYSDNKLEYIATGLVKGSIISSYAMDEYNDYFRIVTTTHNPIKNYLFVLEKDENIDNLKIVGELSDGLGKVDETVKSVRFDKDLAYVVTFRQMDPLYTISLADPTKPVILNAAEEPGYSSYLHVWGENGNIIGLGVNADLSGFVNGLKLSAYNNQSEDPLDTYIFQNNDSNSWGYSEAIYNPKALLVSPKHNLIAFTVNSSTYTEETYTFNSQYLIFIIDFNDQKIIKDPIVISHPISNYNIFVERGIYIKNSNFELIFTFSNNAVISYDLINNMVKDQLNLID